MTVAAVAVVGLALLAGGVLLTGVYRAALTDDVETAARLRSLDVVRALRNGTPPADVVEAGGDGLTQIVDPAGRVDAASASAADAGRISVIRPPRGSAVAETRAVATVPDGPFRIVGRRAETPAGVRYVYVARSLEAVDDSTEHLVRLLVVGYPFLLLLVGVTTWFVIGRALQPVEAIRREVEAITATDLHRRVSVPAADDEVGRLARTMNGMLERIDAAVEQQRRFVADASHELRSPLTAIRADLEVDLAHPERADWQTTERAVLDDTVRLQRLVDDLLALASVPSGPERRHLRLDDVDVDEIVLREARRLRSRSSHTVDTAGVSGAQIVGDEDALARAIRNVLDNADRHARSAVTVTLREDHDGVTLRVMDDGGGVPDDERARIFEPFTRLDEARVRDAGGAGLGLAIAAAIVRAHGGSIAVEPGAGACFVVRIPD